MEREREEREGGERVWERERERGKRVRRGVGFFSNSVF